MKPPTCKLCETRHWLDEEHDTSVLDKVRELGASVLRNTVTKPEVILGAGGRDFKMSPPVVPTNKRTEQALNGQNRPEKNKRTLIKRTEGPAEPTVTRGRPRKWASEAERKRAYRGRSK